jgi:hypothetical protein
LEKRQVPLSKHLQGFDNLEEAFVLLSIENTWNAIRKEIDDNDDDEDKYHSKRSAYA